MNPARLNVSTEWGSTLPVIATIGIVTPAARSDAQTCARRDWVSHRGRPTMRQAEPHHRKSAVAPLQRAYLYPVGALHDDVEQHDASVRLDRARELRPVL